ncbi:MAG: Arc family DNA-binding protein [Betaproteobacteria bacterium]|nr:Arc family DNA-binding protein [Betaproteobacteria bacterium]
MTREINPFGLRMPPELRELLKREARLNGRSLNAELVARLRTGSDPPDANDPPPRGMRLRTTAVQPRNGWVPTDAERAMLTVFRKLPPEKQLALLTLFE